jgi:hypothetical protein
MEDANRWRRGCMMRSCRRKNDRFRKQESTNENLWNHKIRTFGPPKVKNKVTVGVIKVGNTSAFASKELLTQGIRRNDSGWQGRCEQAMDKSRATGMGTWNAEKSMTNRIMRSVVSHFKQSDRIMGIIVAIVPKCITHISGGDHGTTIEMCAKESRIAL